MASTDNNDIYFDRFDDVCIEEDPNYSMYEAMIDAGYTPAPNLTLVQPLAPGDEDLPF
jgi:hypothetical protein